MRAKICMALTVIFAFATSASADFSISDAGFVENVPSLSPQGDYFIVPGLGNAGGFFLAGGPFTDSTINDGTENIGLDALGTGDILSSDLTTDNGGGSFNTLFTLFSAGGDLAPGGLTDGAGVPLDTLAIFVGANAGGTPIDFGSGIVNSAIFEAFDVTGASILGPVDLVPIGFDIQGGSFGISIGAGSAGIGIDTVTLDVNVTKAIPEPTSLAILGGLGLGMVVRRRR